MIRHPDYNLLPMSRRPNRKFALMSCRLNRKCLCEARGHLASGPTPLAQAAGSNAPDTKIALTLVWQIAACAKTQPALDSG